MIWLDVLKALDDVRTAIRCSPDFIKSPRSTVPKGQLIVAALAALVVELEKEAAPAVVTIELDRAGRPVIPDSLRDLFATVPEEFVPPAAPGNTGTGVVRRNPVLNATGRAGPEKPAATTATVLPRDTPRIDHPLDLEDANESTVAE